MNRREFLQQTACATATGAAALSSGCTTSPSGSRLNTTAVPPFPLEEVTIAALQQGLLEGNYSTAELVRLYQGRIAAVDQQGPKLKAVLELNPDALSIAASLDAERATKGPRGPLHGIPILIKDNIGTHDLMQTTAGSLALAGSIAPRDAFIVERLRAAGAVILGKTNLSEWANFRGGRSISGWSARGGQTRNPYFTDRNPSGSSSGSAVATSANLCAAAIGTETNGSIVSPASHCGIVGLKPTVGLISRSGIIPIAASMDTAGPMTRTVADAAVLLSVLAGADPQDRATQTADVKIQADYTQFLDATALRGARLGVLRSSFRMHPKVDPVTDSALNVLQKNGAVLVDVSLPSLTGLSEARFQVMLYEFKAGLNNYFASLGPQASVKNLTELIAFNEKERARELAFFGQEILQEANGKGPLTDPSYLEAKAKLQEWRDVLTRFMDTNKVEAIIAPTAGPAATMDYIHGERGLGGSSTPAATAGFPHITVPCGNVYGLPVGLSFYGRAWSEPKLLALAYAFEQVAKARLIPQLHRSLELA
ncbi:MAG: gatA2 [Verrucomicrobia bacterium]|jgi:amidase|nr:gatA2 [Verrucomicrobiota bacterium]